MQPIHRVHNGPPQWMNAAVLFMTQYPFREGKTEQRGEKCRTPVTISAPVSEVVLSKPIFFTHSTCLPCCGFFFFYSSPCVCLPLVRSAELDSAFPLGLADSQLLFAFVAPVRESGRGQCENSCWQTDETWTLIESESDTDGNCFRLPGKPLLQTFTETLLHSRNCRLAMNIWRRLSAAARLDFRKNAMRSETGCLVPVYVDTWLTLWNGNLFLFLTGLIIQTLIKGHSCTFWDPG